MRKALLAAAAAAAVVTAGSPALASAASAPVVHHARCTEIAHAGTHIVCPMWIRHMGRHPGDVRVVIRTSREQSVNMLWGIGCGSTNVAHGFMNGRTPVREHLLGQAKARGRCRMVIGVVGHRAGSVTLVVSWVNR